MTATVEILAAMVAEQTVSRRPNLGLLGPVRARLEAVGARIAMVESAAGGTWNLLASLGPEGPGGVLLSGHADVVPVEGQAWTRDPFRLSEEGGRLYGRGTADMKGFCAAAVAAMERAARRPLAEPMHLALSADEEIGCVGVGTLIDRLEGAPRPRFCLVGEPTSMAVATGHKGKIALDGVCLGVEGHSALAPMALNALHLACDLAAEIRAMQARIAETGARDPDYDVPYTTLHVGAIRGGTALNIVPNRAEIAFEIRNLAEDDAEAILAEIEAKAAGIVAATGRPEAAIEIRRRFAYPGLSTRAASDAVGRAKRLAGADGTLKVSFGTEGGLFAERLGIETVVCGPGSMAEGHKPDEFVTRDQLGRCDAMLDRLIEGLAGA